MYNLTFVTSNANKDRKVLEILGDMNICYLDLAEIQNTSEEIKANTNDAYAKLHSLVIDEYTSLCAHILNDIPGPYVNTFMNIYQRL